MVKKLNFHELNLAQQADLDHKIAVANRVIADALAISTRPALAFSGGKDSTVLWHLIRSHPWPSQPPTSYEAQKLLVIFGNTLNEFQESRSFVRRMAREWNTDIVEARPGKTTRPGLKYAAQRRVWQYLIDTGRIAEVLKPDGKLKSTISLERACPPDLYAEFEASNLIWLAGTTMTYRWCTDQYGFPLLGKSYSKLAARRINIDTFLRFSQSTSNDPALLAYYNILRQVKISQNCCKILKKDPARRVQRALGVDLIFKGLMASESRSRAMNFVSRGWLFEGAKQSYLDGRPFWHCQPMATWTDEDVWAYIHRYGLPYAPLYDMTYTALDGSTQKIRRNGCIGCATDFGYRNNHLYILRQTHPKQWRAVMQAGMAQQIRNLQQQWRAVMQAGMAQQIRNLQRALRVQDTLFDLFSTKELLDAQPCVFDDLGGLGGRPEPTGLEYDPEV